MAAMAEDVSDRQMQALQARAVQALAHWGLDRQVPVLLKYRENAVFRVVLATGEPAALRLHRPGYRDDRVLASELAWMSMLRTAGLAVPVPVPTPDGRIIVPLPASPGIDAQHADIVSWMSGSPIGQSGVTLSHDAGQIEAIFHALGAAMALMHTAADGWTPPATFHRPSWDSDGLVGEAPLWGRFWDCPGLLPEERAQLTALRQSLRRRISDLPGSLDYGLIHADLVRENVLVNGSDVELIDFDDAGYGWRLFDIATALFKNRGEPQFPLIQSALIAGYRTRRPLSDPDLDHLPLFMLLRSVTYIGWLGERPDAGDAKRRMRRYVAESLELGAALAP
jgi:Ser/Thr protein kinase RdoA (MazF antagonist)